MKHKWHALWTQFWLDWVHGLSGHCPWTKWTMSMASVNIVHGLTAHCPWTQWKFVEFHGLPRQSMALHGIYSMAFHMLMTKVCGISCLAMAIHGITQNAIAFHPCNNAMENLGIALTFSINFRIAWKSTESQVSILCVLSFTYYYMAFHVIVHGVPCKIEGRVTQPPSDEEPKPNLSNTPKTLFCFVDHESKVSGNQPTNIRGFSKKKTVAIALIKTCRQHMSHITRKRVFRDFRPGQIQTRLISYRP